MPPQKKSIFFGFMAYLISQSNYFFWQEIRHSIKLSQTILNLCSNLCLKGCCYHGHHNLSKLQQLQRISPPTALFAGADGGIVASHAGDSNQLVFHPPGGAHPNYFHGIYIYIVSLNIWMHHL